MKLGTVKTAAHRQLLVVEKEARAISLAEMEASLSRVLHMPSRVSDSSGRWAMRSDALFITVRCRSKARAHRLARYFFGVVRRWPLSED